MVSKSRALVGAVVLSALWAGSAAAATTLYSDNFSTLAPPAGGFTTTSSFTSGIYKYSVKGSPDPTPGNVDIVSSTYKENNITLCPAGTCVDLDGTGEGRRNDYLFTTGDTGTFTLLAGQQYTLTVKADATSRNQQSPFIFGLLRANDDLNPLSSTSYATVGAASPGAGPSTGIVNGFHDYVFNFTIGSLGVASGTTARLFFENYANATSDNIGALIGSASLTASPVPLPAAAWLLLSGLAGLGLVSRRRGTKPRPEASATA